MIETRQVLTCRKCNGSTVHRSILVFDVIRMECVKCGHLVAPSVANRQRKIPPIIADITDGVLRNVPMEELRFIADDYDIDDVLNGLRHLLKGTLDVRAGDDTDDLREFLIEEVKRAQNYITPR